MSRSLGFFAVSTISRLALCPILCAAIWPALIASAQESASPPAILTGTVVDEVGKPVAGATVRSEGGKTSQTVTTDGSGQFGLAVERSPTAMVFAMLSAETPDGRLGSLSVRQEKDKAEPVKVVVRPGRELLVVVIDAVGKPVEGAEIEFLGDMRRLAGGLSDSGGSWSGRVPADVKAWGVFARKSGVG